MINNQRAVLVSSFNKVANAPRVFKYVSNDSSFRTKGKITGTDMA